MGESAAYFRRFNAMLPDDTDSEQTQPLAPPPPPVFGDRFRVIRVLGTGAMGDVYLAQDTKLHRRVAIKCIRSEHRASAMFLQRIKRECLLHARTGAHPHIVTLYDLLESEDQLLIVMEYVEGEALDVVLKRQAGSGTSLAPAWCAAIAVQCLEALSHTHRHGIIHRDIKPANVILDGKDADKVCAKLMDFGIARLEEEDPAVTTLTQPGARSPGTPLYMSPEQIDSGTYGPVTPSADLYAMGVMLYHMLSGRPPFTGTMTDIFNGHLNFTPKPILLDSGSPPDPALVAVLDRAMAKRPADRFSTAAAFAGALRPFATGGGAIRPLATEPSAVRPRGGSRRKPVGLAAAVGLALLIVVGGALWWAGSRGDETAPGRAPEALAHAPALPVAVETTAAPEPAVSDIAPADVSPPYAEIPEVDAVGAAGTEPGLNDASPAGAGDTAIEDWTLDTVTLPTPAPVYGLPGTGPDAGPLPEIIPPARATVVPDAPVVADPVDAARPEADVPEALETVAMAAPPAPEDRDSVGGSDPVDAAAPAVVVIGPTHVVQRGDTIQGIAAKYDLAAADLIQWNQLHNPDALSVGQTLYLYERPDLPPASAPPAAEPAPEAKGSPGQVFKEDVKEVWDKAGRGIRNLGRKVRNVGN